MYAFSSIGVTSFGFVFPMDKCALKGDICLRCEDVENNGDELSLPSTDPVPVVDSSLGPGSDTWDTSWVFSD